MVEVIVLAVAVLAGVAARGAKLPPMVGYLVAGFALHGLSGYWPALASIDFGVMADVGITILLFTIGLKLDFRSLTRSFVWAVTCLHMGFTVVVIALVLALLKLVGWSYLAQFSTVHFLTVGFALSFSSTVFAVKVLEERGEMVSLHGRTAIGILVMQDIFAVIYLSAIGDGLPAITAPLVLLLIPLRRPIHLLLQRCGHGELLALAGFAVAFGVYGLFELVHLKGSLGALFAGVLLAGTVKGNELAKTLLTIKDLLLVGFFLSIGSYGLPGTNAWMVAMLFVALLFLKPLVYFLLLARFRLRAQTAWFSALVLNQYSEFGLIVMSLAAEEGLLPAEWLVITAIAVSLSFIISSTVNLRGDWIYSRVRNFLFKWQTDQRVPEQSPLDIGRAEILVMGMGRLGTGAYDYLKTTYGDTVLGFDENTLKVREHLHNGRLVLVGDASDADLWQRLPLERVRKIILALSNHTETMRVTEILRSIGYTGVIAAVAKFDDDLQQLKSKGVIAFNFYAEAGAGFAEHVVNHLAQGSR